jgi:acyl carrier protein
MRDKLLQILTDLRPEFDFTEDVNFIEEGMLDSFDMVALVADLESAFGVKIDGVDIVPENFYSLEALENLINNSKKA